MDGIDSETQKFGHVTFFWNGNRSGKINDLLEVYHEIPSDNIKFNEAPHMKAADIAKAAQDALLSGQFDYVRVNFANGDMVGHTGDLEATKKACEAVDHGVKVRVLFNFSASCSPLQQESVELDWIWVPSLVDCPVLNEKLGMLAWNHKRGFIGLAIWNLCAPCTHQVDQGYK